MPRTALEVADIFRSHGAAWRKANAGHLSLGQLKAMAAIEACRTAELGGHIASCHDCGHTRIAYNSCGNRHCPKCQGSAAREWLAEQEAGLLPLPYYHVVFTLPSAIGAIAWQNKALVYGLLFKAASGTMLTIAADPKHLGARIGMTAVLHTWGSALTHHPHVHMIVPGGALSPDGERFVPCRGRRRRFFHRVYSSRGQHRAAARASGVRAAARGEPWRNGGDSLAALSPLRRAHDDHRVF